MLTPETRGEVARITEAILATRPLIDVLPGPVRIMAPLAAGGRVRTADGQPCGSVAEAQALLDRITSRLRCPRLVLCADALRTDLNAFERIVDAELNLPGRPALVVRQDPGSLAGMDAVVDEVQTRSFEQYRANPDVSTGDARLHAYAAGVSGNPAVIISSACGMPAKLSEAWVRCLAKSYFVMIWETRGLFGEVGNFDTISHGVDAQIADLFAVMDHYQVKNAHVMGFCTGAVIALAAAQARPDRVSSLSLWHGSYEMGADFPITDHARYIRELMAIAARGRAEASMVHAVLCDVMLKGATADMPQQVLYPYVTPELLYRYCTINGVIAAMDVVDMLTSIPQPTLVVTSETDVTTHPDASRRVAGLLRRATLHVEPSGDHISLFKARPRLQYLANDFLSHDTIHAGHVRDGAS